MQAARVLFAAACRAGTGAVVVAPPDDAFRARIELQRGFVYALGYSPPEGSSGQAEENLRRLLKRAAATSAQGLFEENASPTQRGRVTPFHPAQVVRNHFEAELPEGAGNALRARAGKGHVQLTVPPHPSCLGPDEKRVIALLTIPRTLGELDASRVALPQRIDKLLAFLSAAEALSLEAAGPSPWAALELPEHASAEEVRRAFRRLALQLHPDRHQAEPEPVRRALEQKLVAVTQAYRLLLP